MFITKHLYLGIMKIVEVNHSVANRFKGYIEINKNLKKYPKLFEPIVSHELMHTDEAFTWKDFKLDFFSNSKVDNWELMKFMLKHPRSFSQLLPVLYSKKTGVVIDVNLLVMYLIMICIFVLAVVAGARLL